MWKKLTWYFIDIDGGIKTGFWSKNPKVAVLVKWFTRKGVEEMLAEHHQLGTQLVGASHYRARKSDPHYPIWEYWPTKGNLGKRSPALRKKK